jgi:RNA polymerase sporulation-specific sigma factor
MQETVRKKDEELVALAQSGDKRASDELLLRYMDVVRCCARGFFLVGGETEDLLQEGMIGLYHAIVDYKFEEGGSSFKNFAYLCVQRRIIDAVRSAACKKNQPLNGGVTLEDSSVNYPDYYLTPEDLLILSDERKELKHSMSRVLSDFEYKITSMYVDGMTCAEICEATGKSMKSVDNAIQRSKKKLQKILKK